MVTSGSERDRKEVEAEMLNFYLSKAKQRERNLTDSLLARKMGVSASNFSQWKKGKTNIPDKHWLFLAKRLYFNALQTRPELAQAYAGMKGISLAMRIEALDQDNLEVLVLVLDALEQRQGNL